MKRIRRASVVLIAVALIVSLTMVIPASAKNGEGNVKVLDSEFVVCTMASNGDIEEVQVFNQLSLNGDGTVTVREEKALEDVGGFQAVKGFAKPSVEGDYIVWPEIKVDRSGSVIANTKLSEAMVEEVRTRIPLDISIKYWFDGTPVSDLKTITGKDGRFKMEMTLKNESKETTEVEYEDPATGQMVTGEVETYLPMVILPYDWYFDNSIFFNLEADPTCVIVPMPDFFNTGWSIPLFPPATEESHTIWVAADVKNFQMPPITLAVVFEFPHTNQVDTTATISYAGGLLYDGMRQVNEGIGTTDNKETLLGGITALNDGVQQLAAALPEAPAAVTEQMIPGVQEAVAGIGSADTDLTLLYAVNAIESGLQQISAGLGSAETPGTAINGLYQVMMGLSNPDDPANPGFKQGLEQLVMGLALLEASLGTAQTSLGTAQYDLRRSPLRQMTSLDAGTIRQLVNDNTNLTPAEKQNLLDRMDTVASITQGVIANLQAVIDGLTGNIGLLQYISDTTNTQFLPGVTQLYDGVTQLYGGLVGMQAGIGTATTDNTLLYAVAAVEDGLSQLKAGLSSGDISNPGLVEGLEELVGGLNEAVAGIGTTGTPDTLAYGMNSLAGAVPELKDGTLQLEEGLYTLMSTLNMTHAQLEAITQRGEEFDHILGRAQDADSQVRFVYQTKPTYNYKTGSSTSWIVAIILSVVIALLLVAGGILLARRSTA